MSDPIDYVIHLTIILTVASLMGISLNTALYIAAISAVGIEGYWLVIKND